MPTVKTPLLPQHREKRFNFAVDYANWPEAFWAKNTVFSDEKTFRSDENGMVKNLETKRNTVS